MFNYQSTLFYAFVVCIFGWIQPGLGQVISGIVSFSLSYLLPKENSTFSLSGHDIGPESTHPAHR